MKNNSGLAYEAHLNMVIAGPKEKLVDMKVLRRCTRRYAMLDRERGNSGSGREITKETFCYRK
jgi:hypothetical protein